MGQNDFGNVYSSPILSAWMAWSNFGRAERRRLGVNPHNGDMQWAVPFKADYSIAVSTPMWGPDNLLFVPPNTAPARKGSA